MPRDPMKVNNILSRRVPPSKPKDPDGSKGSGSRKKQQKTQQQQRQSPQQKRGWHKALEGEGGGNHHSSHGPDVTSQLSDLSDSSAEENGGSIDDNSTDFQNFERALRHKHSKACKAMSNGVYNIALEEFESILSDLLNRYGERHERVGAALHNVAIANLRAGSLDDAMDAIEEAIKIRSRALGRSHPKVADSLVELGIILLSMEEHDDALKVFDRALKLRREEHDDCIVQDEVDESNLKIAKVLNNIGCVNYEKGSYYYAKESFEEAIRLQMSVFRNWFNFVCGVDTSSPGVLTMASTMCNKGYVEVEQSHFEEAVRVFTESLKIQKAVLGDGNKLVQSSLDNLGYAYSMLGQTERALKVYLEIWTTQKDSNDQPEEKIETIRKIVVCHVRLDQFAKAFEYLELLEDTQQELDEDSKDLKITRKLMGEVNYQLLKLPSLSDATNRALGCAVCMGPTEEEIDLEAWVIPKPENTSKMSGHRVTHA